MIKKVLFFIMCLFSMVSVSAVELAPNAKSVILIEASTGKVLYERDADIALAPASMTKIMTLLLTMEAIESGNIKLDDMVHISENAANMGGSQVYLAANTEMKLEEIIKAVCIASGNDAAYVLAEAIGGTHDNFVLMMNKKAKELGLTGTNFVNSYGLDAKGHLSTARDMAIMARELIKHDLILKYSSIYEEYLNKPDGTSTWMVNTNKLVRFYAGIDGLKTGYTTEAGYCLTATGIFNNMRLISVVMGEPSQEARSDDTVELINYGKTNFKLKNILKKGDKLGEIEVELGNNLVEDAIIDEDINDIIDAYDDTKKYTCKIRVDKLIAPIKKRDKVGEVDIYIDDVKYLTKDLTVNDDVNKISFMNLIKRIFKVITVGS